MTIVLYCNYPATTFSAQLYKSRLNKWLRHPIDISIWPVTHLTSLFMPFLHTDGPISCTDKTRRYPPNRRNNMSSGHIDSPSSLARRVSTRCDTQKRIDVLFIRSDRMCSAHDMCSAIHDCVL